MAFQYKGETATLHKSLESPKYTKAADDQVQLMLV